MVTPQTDMDGKNRKKSRKRLFKIITFLLVLIICIPLGEIANNLYYKITEENDTSYDQKVNQDNTAFSEHNTFCFTDVERSPKNPKKKFRIAVLGDSFIWGSGLPYEKAWSHRLEDKLMADYDSIEVLHWGICGWSTRDELNFLKNNGKAYNIDLLIVGWVENDPDMGRVQQVYFTEPSVQYPRLYKFSPVLARILANSNEQDGYEEWLQYIYTPANLLAYQQVLDSFHSYLVARDIPAVFVMTPNIYNDILHANFLKAQPLILNAQFPCLNLFDKTVDKFGKLPQEQLMASAVNAHPGPLLTEAFSSEVKAYLEKNNYLINVPKIKKQ